MHTESRQTSELETLHSANVPTEDVDVLASLSRKVVVSQDAVKKQTRQWAAWTRQEEENFFNALRLVGKDFDKITCRVQTKNKDQVRHYYYRLIRRMNKLLAPGFSLNAKNSKDTIAAMLRWWSLLEKYSCTASKLHLKPRRFKIFVEALEHQLLKDRRRSKRRGPSQVDNCPLVQSAATFSLLGKTNGNDTQTTKLLIIDSHNIQKVVSGRGASSLKRGVNMSSSCGDGDPSNVKMARQRRKTGTATSASYRRWEKAAMAGVNLVADAAEHLERKTNNEKDSSADGKQATMSSDLPFKVHPDDLSPPLATTHKSCVQRSVIPTDIQPSIKLKLQLFPVDEVTRRALEKVEHNPHLELTLSGRKKISSVLDHLRRKWANSSIELSGELILFPYCIQQETWSTCQRWTTGDTVSTAADVYAAVGYPSVFRLRYGWFSNGERKSSPLSAPSTPPRSDGLLQQKDVQEMNAEVGIYEDQPVNNPTVEVVESLKSQLNLTADEAGLPLLQFSEYICDGISPICEAQNQASLTESLNVLQFRKKCKNYGTTKQCEDVVNMGTGSGITLSAGEWADTLTNISMGDILSEVSRAADVNCGEQPLSGFQHSSFNSDSFDATIASHLRGSSESATNLPIWDGEETCDGFLFQKVRTSLDKDISTALCSSLDGLCSVISQPGLIGSHMAQEIAEIGNYEEPSKNDPVDNTVPDGQREDNPGKDQSLSDMYWPDSLGPLDLDIGSSRYQEPILGDSTSLSGLSRLIASSVDAFQNFSVFSSNKKDLLADDAPHDNCRYHSEV